jgi:CRP-like cAMP-binding protein
MRGLTKHAFMGAEESLFQRFGKEFAKGTILFLEGQPGREMYVLQSGKVAISKKVREVEKVLAVLGPGEFFGEMAVISNRPRNASAVVQEDAKLLVIDSKTFEGMIRGNSEIAVRMIKKLADRLSEADEQIENLLLADPTSRVLRMLLKLGSGEHELVPKEQAKLIGISEMALLRILGQLSQMGFLSFEQEKVKGVQVAGLEEYLRFIEMKWKFGEL